MRDDDCIVYPPPMRCKYPNEEPKHLTNADGSCTECTYARDMAIWESLPSYVEGQIS